MSTGSNLQLQILQTLSVQWIQYLMDMVYCLLCFISLYIVRCITCRGTVIWCLVTLYYTDRVYVNVGWLLRWPFKDGISLKGDICHHGAPMQLQWLTRRCRFGASCWPFGSVLIPEGSAWFFECSNGRLHARAAFMHHDDQGHDAVTHYAVLKWKLRSTLFC